MQLCWLGWKGCRCGSLLDGMMNGLDKTMVHKHRGFAVSFVV